MHHEIVIVMIKLYTSTLISILISEPYNNLQTINFPSNSSEKDTLEY